MATENEQEVEEVQEDEFDYDSHEVDSSIEKSVNDLLSSFSGEKEEEGDQEPEQEQQEEEDGQTEGESKSKEDKDEVSSLKNEIAELKSLVREMKNSEPKEKEVKEPEPFKVAIEDEQYDRALSSREGFQELMDDLMQKTIARTRELYLSEVPEIVQSEVSTQGRYKDMVLNFYQSNQDLVGHKDYVSYVYTSLEKQNPDAKPNELLAETANKVRKDLNLAKSKEKGPKKNPGLASSKGGKAPVQKTKLEGQEAEVAALLELDN